MHLRLILRDSRLLPYAMEMQKTILARITRLDPLSPAWMAGISWRLDIAGDAAVKLPDAGYWQRVISNPPASATEVEAEASTPELARAALDRLFGPGDSKRRDDSQPDRPDFGPTQPMEIGLERGAVPVRTRR